ncbi:MAG TPA: hypothetical protein VKC61_08225 [Pyrinomonadaceae bacterium]|nr:hypothetical protein [Pyrinomonadaceae bacterium]
MKRRSRFSWAQITHCNFHSIYIFRPGLEELVDIIQQEEPATLQVYDADYEYESLTEFLDKYDGKDIATIAFLATFPDSVLITLSKQKITFHASETTPKTLGLLTRLKPFFSAHRRASTGVLFSPFPFWAGVFLLVGLVSVFSWVPIGVRIVIDFALFIIALSLFTNDAIGRFSRIFSTNRHEQESFWFRNKDVLLAGLISAVIGASLSFIVAYLLFRGGIY